MCNLIRVCAELIDGFKHSNTESGKTGCTCSNWKKSHKEPIIDPRELGQMPSGSDLTIGMHQTALEYACHFI